MPEDLSDLPGVFQEISGRRSPLESQKMKTLRTLMKTFSVELEIILGEVRNGYTTGRVQEAITNVNNGKAELERLLFEHSGDGSDEVNVP